MNDEILALVGAGILIVVSGCAGFFVGKKKGAKKVESVNEKKPDTKVVDACIKN